MSSFEGRLEIYCYNILFKTTSNFNKVLLESYDSKPSDNFGINLEYLSYGSCCLLYTLLMTQMEQGEAELLVESVVEEITNYWDNLQIEDMLNLAAKTDPIYKELINKKTNEKFISEVTKDVIKVIAVPNQITTKQGMRLDYVINRTKEYWSCIIKQISSISTNYSYDPITWIEEEVEQMFLNNIYPIVERPVYNKGKGIFHMLSFLMREEFDNEMALMREELEDMIDF